MKSLDAALFSSLVHKVKGGAQLLNAKNFVKKCIALEGTERLEKKVTLLIQLLEEQNKIICFYQEKYVPKKSIPKSFER
jgi:two-component system sensor histidine kinase EvgS